MGCCQNTTAYPHNNHNLVLSDEELAISKFESMTPFSNKSSKLLTSEILLQGKALQISNSQFELILRELGIDINNLKDNYPHLIESIKDSPITYNVEKVLLLSILLCKGKPREKCGLLFEYADNDRNDSINIHDIEKLLFDLIDVTLKITPLAAVGNDKLNIHEVERYCENLAKCKRFLVKKLKFEIMAGETELDSTEFDLRIFESENLKNLISASGVRFLLSEYLMMLSSIDESITESLSPNKTDINNNRSIENSRKDLA